MPGEPDACTAGAPLTAALQLDLLTLAHAALAAAANGSPPVQPPGAGPFLQPAAVFVSWTIAGRLRGCIGCIEAREPLGIAVVRLSMAAGREDPRFEPIGTAELSIALCEISILGPLVPITSVDDIEIGRDGLVVEQRGRRGVLLPRVAVEWRWGRERFLNETCVKAGLAPNAWRMGARLFRFEAIVISEEAVG